MDKIISGDKKSFALEYSFFRDSHETELGMYINGKNILAFERNNQLLTTRWNLDTLALWLRDFVDGLEEDPFPFDCEGEYAAQKDDSARDFDSDDEVIFDAYYQKLYDWDLRHRWHHTSDGAVLADVYFQLVGNYIEISWDNRDSEEGVLFQCEYGGCRIQKEEFISSMKGFLKDYALYWMD